MKKTNTTTTTAAERRPLNITATATAEELYTAAEIATSIALRTLHSKTGLDLYADLIRAYTNDRKARNAATIATAADDAENRRNESRRAAEEYRRIARRLSIDEDTRTAAADLANLATAEADHAAEEESDTRRGFEGVIFSDRADLTQAAAAALVDTWSNPAEITEERRIEYAAELGKTPEELTPEELEDMQTAANFRTAISAARCASTQLAHPDALTGNRTKRTEATPADVAAWLETMGGTGKDFRRPAYIRRTKATDCFDTMENMRGQWYAVRHYRTVNRYDSIEALNESNPAALLADWENAHTAADAVMDIIERANLTDRERTAVLYFLSHEAGEAAEQNRRQYMNERHTAAEAAPNETRRNQILSRAEATAENKAAVARWEYALTKAGYKSNTSRQRGQAAILDALKAATHRRPATISNTAAPVWDALAWMTTAAPAHVAAVEWMDEATAERARAEAEAAEKAAHDASRIDNTTPEALEAGKAAAELYTAAHAAELKAAEKAAVDAKAAAKAAKAAERAAEREAAERWAKQLHWMADRPGEILEAVPGGWETRRAKAASSSARVFLANMPTAELMKHYRSR